MSQHTPGPWRIEGPDDDPYGKIGVFAEAPSRLVCELWQDDAPDRDYNAEQWDNARLIAAAPEMAQVLREYLAWGAMTGSDRYMFEERFTELLKRINGEQP